MTDRAASIAILAAAVVLMALLWCAISAVLWVLGWGLDKWGGDDDE